MTRLVLTVFIVLAMSAGLNSAMADGKDDHAKSAGGHKYIVKMKYDENDGRFYYEPARLKIHSGDTVIWVDDDAINEHNVVAYPDGIPQGVEMFEGPLLNEVGQTYSITFTKPGTYRYHCHPHEALGMRGEIIVDRESRPDEFRKASSSEMHHHTDMPDMDMSGHAESGDGGAAGGHDGGSDHDH